MLNSVKKICDKKKTILTLVLSEKKYLNETKNHNPPFKLNGRSLTINLMNLNTCFITLSTNSSVFSSMFYSIHNC